MSTQNSSSAATRLTSAELLAPGTWEVDAGHTEVAFVGRHFGFTKIRGRFTGVAGTATIAEDAAASHIEVTIDMASVSSGDQSRDDHLRAADFFDVERHPTATFRSTAVAVIGTEGELTGLLTIKGITRPVTLAVEFLGHVVDPWGNDRAIFSASGVIDREDWDLTWNMLLEAGGLLVSKEIRLEIETELIRQ
jgi:polyisoprenoid-binding protein YceI